MDMIIISVNKWNLLAEGTKYSAQSLSSAVTICIEIADRKYGHCQRGIGFGCSMLDWPGFPGKLSNVVNNKNRFCAVEAKRIRNNIRIIFLDHIDWQSLLKDQ